MDASFIILVPPVKNFLSRELKKNHAIFLFVKGTVIWDNKRSEWHEVAPMIL
jgi:hypothetical protein